LATRTLTAESATRIPPRPWWETWWCIALALLLVAVPPLSARVAPLMGSTRDGVIGLLIAALAPALGSQPVEKAIVIAIPVLAAAAMLWLSRTAHGRIQPSAYFALPFAFLRASPGEALAVALALGAFAVWLRLAGWPWLRAAVFVMLSALICASHVIGWLCLLVMIFAAEHARERAVERDGVRRGQVACGWHAALACLPLAPAVLIAPAWHPGGATDWLASLPLKPGSLMMALRDHWPMFDAVCMIVVALVLYKSHRDRRFVHAPMLVAAAIGLLLLFVAVPGGAAGPVASCAIALALLSIRCNARVKLHRRSEVAWAALAFLAIRTAAGTASVTIGGTDSRELPAASHPGLSHPATAR